MKINTKLLIAFVIIALIPLGVISILSYVSAKDALTSQVLSHLQSVAEIQRNRIESIVEQNLERLNLVSSRTQLRISLDSFINNPNADDQDKINQILLDARSSVSSFRDISVLTLDGKAIASTDAAKIGGTYLNDEAFIRGQNENTADIFFLDENESLCIYLSGPLYLEGNLLGVVVIESTADSILSSIKDYTGLGTTGETQLAETDENGDAVFITPTRFDKDAALSRTVPKEEVNSPTIQALLKNEKLFTDAVDYRGEPVLAATEYISKTGWGLVTKIDKAEALAPVAHLQYLLLTIVLLSLALILIVSLFLSRAITRPIIKLVHMATKVSEGDLTVRAEVTSRDEIGTLAQACNQMKDSLVKTNSELEQELAERKRAEEKYSTLVERGNDGIIIIQDGLVKFANTKMVEMTGFSLDEATGKSFLEFVSPEYRASVMESYQRRVSGEEVPNNYEIEIIAKDGSRIAVEINASRIEYEEKLADMAIVRDITERKRAEDALRQSEERYRDLFDNANDLIQSVSPDGHLLYVNKAWRKVLGYTEKEVANLKVWDIIHPDSMNHCMETFQRVMSGEAVNDIEAVFVAKDGSPVAVEGNAHCRFIDGKPASTQGIFRDVTARKEAEERIAHLNSVLRALRDINQLITRESDRERLIQKSCDILVRTRGYERVWILLTDENRSPVSIAAAGLGEESAAFLEQMRQGKYPYCVRELWAQENAFLAYDCPGNQHKECILAGIHSSRGVYRCRLEYEGKIYGILGVTVSSEMVSDEEEQKLFLELRGDISFALASIEREDKRKQAEEQTEQLKGYLQLQVDRMPIALIVWDTDFRVQSWNPSAEKMFGFTIEEALGRHPYDIIVPKEAQPQVDNIWSRLLEGDTTAHSINENMTKDGHIILCEWINTPMRKADGTVVGVLSMVQDITERKQAEELFRILIDSSPVGIYIAQGGKFQLVNSQFEQYTGYSKDELLGMDSLKLVLPEDKNIVKENTVKMLKGKRSSPYEYRVVNKAGETRWVTERVTSINYRGSQATLGNYIDITERKKAEEALRKSEASLAKAQCIAHVGSWDWDILKNEVSYSDEFHRMFGRHVRNLEAFLDSLHPDDREFVEKSIHEALNKNRPYDIEYRVILPNGAERVIYAQGEVTFDNIGKPIWMIGTVQDITERKNMQEQLILTDRLASIGELASGIAHELNNPLTGVIGLSQLLVERDIPEDVKEDLKLVYSEAQRAAGVVRNLLTFARKHPPAKELISVNDVISKVLELRAYEEKVSNIQVVTHLASDLPQIMADYFQMQQVFLNIIINAEHFMLEAHGKGTLTITTQKVGDVVRASFADDGPGIPKENLGHIFDPFFTTKEVGKGTGLGLSICHGIVSAHSGRIYAESEPRKGATFIVELPIKQQE